MKRSLYITKITNEFEINPVVALLGPRQCGKTTLADQYVKQSKEPFHKFDLEDPEDLAALNTHPREKNHISTLPENFDGILHSHAYEVKFLNANPNPTIVAEKIQPFYSNFFIYV